MLYYFFALLTAAVILLANDLRSETNRWAAFFLCCASIGGLSDTIREAGYVGWSQAAQSLNVTLTPYGVLVFCMVYSERITRPRSRLYYKMLLLCPVAFMLAAAPFATGMDYLLLLAWTAPYYLVSCYLLIVSLWKETDHRKKRNRFITTIIIVPTLLAVLALINIAKVISPEFEPFSYVSLFIAYSLVVAVLCTFLYGVLGVKLRFERDQLESTMKAVSSGAALLNHTIKNEMGKIAISTENLRHSIPEASGESAQHLQIISSSADHMLAMAARIHSQMRDILLKEQPCRLDQLVQECVREHHLLLENQGVQVTAQYASRPTILCDAVHLKEVMGNLLMNAAEAMPSGGTIDIRLQIRKKDILLSFADTGKGISSGQLAHVFEPFYSTKNRSRNFGLGLSYVYNVMQRSGGSIELSSRENAGTVVTLLFPRGKMVQTERRHASEPH